MTRTGKQISRRDALRIEAAILDACETEATGIFHRDLTEGCAMVGWSWHHPMTLWTVAIHANVFPVRHTPRDARSFEGPLVFGRPGFALKHSELELFWDDPDLVGLAKRRAERVFAPQRASNRRVGAMPYDGW